jgi:Transposase zinc-binding domain
MRPKLEMADIFRRHGDTFRAAQANRLSLDQRKVMAAIEVCRTPALGAHVERCEDCGETRISYNSCLMGTFSNGELACWRRPFSCELQRSFSP